MTRLLLAMVLVLPFTSANAQEPLADRYSVALGAYSVHARTGARLDADGGRIGTSFSFEDDLGVEPEVWARYFELAVRFGERHRFEIEQFAFDRSGEWTNLRQIRFGNDVYDVGFVLDTDFDTDVTRLGYDYAFSRNDRHEIGVGIGVHLTDISIGVRVAFQPLTSATQEFADTTAPLPVVGVHGAYRVFPRWTLRGQAQIFRLEAGDYEGELNHVALAFEHDTFRHVGFGVALDFFELDLDSNDAGFLGAFNLKFYGPRLFVRTHF